MTTRNFSGLAIAAFATAICVSNGAYAAATVIGPGPAQDCFHIAEYGGDVRDGIQRCTFALNDALTVADRAATFVNRGVLELKLRQTDAALEDINNGIRMSPVLGDAYIDRGAVSIAMGRYDDALADLNKGIDLGPHRPQVAYYDRAIVLEQRGDIRGAYNDYKKALDIQPDFPAASEELKRFRVVQKDNGV